MGTAVYNKTINKRDAELEQKGSGSAENRKRKPFLPERAQDLDNFIEML